MCLGSSAAPVTGHAGEVTSPGRRRGHAATGGVFRRRESGRATARRERGELGSEHVDHDHRAGWVRGILCINCNGGLSPARDARSRLVKVITYLRGTTWQQVLIHPGGYPTRSSTWGPLRSPIS
ncbi:MAG: hypothetical protein DIU79_17020 [Actinobacteria bacterium]|nr:MAG: hypothetical protein DIU79_17020 [Actinomycetota bacterium]